MSRLLNILFSLFEFCPTRIMQMNFNFVHRLDFWLQRVRSIDAILISLNFSYIYGLFSSFRIFNRTKIIMFVFKIIGSWLLCEPMAFLLSCFFSTFPATICFPHFIHRLVDKRLQRSKVFIALPMLFDSSSQTVQYDQLFF